LKNLQYKKKKHNTNLYCELHTNKAQQYKYQTLRKFHCKYLYCWITRTQANDGYTLMCEAFSQVWLKLTRISYLLWSTIEQVKITSSIQTVVINS